MKHLLEIRIRMIYELGPVQGGEPKTGPYDGWDADGVGFYFQEHLCVANLIKQLADEVEEPNVCGCSRTQVIWLGPLKGEDWSDDPRFSHLGRGDLLPVGMDELSKEIQL
jgi:hypothetical protein